ncbi:metallophosphoesterase [Thiohalobacter sp.]|uniref:metallophosphoesterase n=1 Tax=Thiohalobacter sp. TaxID=2025948 RepID=UPI0026271640|nr:metallophosphoesterase [Thiohalobacter sp.]
MNEALRCPPMPETVREQLEARIGRTHLAQRLGMECDYEARVFAPGRTFFHIENWYSIHGWMRGLLRLSGLHGRGQRNARRIRIRERSVALPRLDPAFEGFRILQVSDLHLDMADDMPAALIEAVRGLEYDLCVLTGDFRARTFGPFQAAVEGLARVRPYLRGPVLAVLGNHDTIRMVPDIEALDIRVLLNESTVVTRREAALHVAGIDDPHFHRADNLERAAEAIPGDAVSLLLAHSPEIYRHAAYAGFDLMLCGHTHGGQICLPGGIPVMCNARAPRRFCRGAWRFRDLQGYTSTGSGACVVDVRLNCPPEVVVHRLTRG